MMRYLIALSAFVALCSAQAIAVDVLPFDDPRCVEPAWVKWDRTNSYVSGFSGVTRVCTRPYVDVCLSPNGVQPCNNHYGSCREVSYAWDDKTLFPTGPTNTRPSVCVSGGNFFASDTKVLVIAQVIFGFVMLLIAVVLVIRVGRATPGFSFFVVIAQLLMSWILMFSYFYLNGIIHLAAAISALALFRARRPVLTGFGIAFLLAAFFWTTYRFGLGNMQHQARFNAGIGSADTFENYCNSYYRGYFTWVPALHSLDENPAEGTWGYCTRNWLAAELFFQIFAQTLLVLQAATGIQSLLYVEKKPVVSDTEPAQ